jgi:SAM-dependent methyltransferase
MKSALVRFFQRFDVRWEFYRRVKESRKILELGCGSGLNYRNLRLLASPADFYGVDLLPPEEAPEGILYSQLNLDTDALPYPDGSFDAILFTHVIEHLRNPLALGKEINRVLKPGGVIYVETPNWTSMLVPSFRFRRDQHNPFNFFDDPTHIRPYTSHSLFEFLQEACRLRVETIAIVRNWPRIPWDCLKMIQSIATGNRVKLINAFWNVYGWCVCGIGVKE